MNQSQVNSRIVETYQDAVGFAVPVSFGLMSLLAVASLFGYLLMKLRQP